MTDDAGREGKGVGRRGDGVVPRGVGVWWHGRHDDVLKGVWMGCVTHPIHPLKIHPNREKD